MKQEAENTNILNWNEQTQKNVDCRQMCSTSLP